MREELIGEFVETAPFIFTNLYQLPRLHRFFYFVMPALSELELLELSRSAI